MGHQMRDSFCAHEDLSYFLQLIFGLLRCNMMKSKAIPDVIDQRKILSSLVNADDIHKIRWTLPSILTKFCMQIFSTSPLVGAYLSLFLRKITWGKHSLSLWGLVAE